MTSPRNHSMSKRNMRRIARMKSKFYLKCGRALNKWTNRKSMSKCTHNREMWMPLQIIMPLALGTRVDIVVIYFINSQLHYYRNVLSKWRIEQNVWTIASHKMCWVHSCWTISNVAAFKIVIHRNNNCALGSQQQPIWIVFYCKSNWNNNVPFWIDCERRHV